MASPMTSTSSYDPLTGLQTPASGFQYPLEVALCIGSSAIMKT